MAPVRHDEKRVPRNGRGSSTSASWDPSYPSSELLALQRIAVAVGSTRDPDVVLHTALKVLVDVTGADGGIAHVWDDVGQTFRYARHQNVPEAVLAEMREFALGEGIAGGAAERFAPLVIDDLSRSPGNVFPASVAAGHRSIAVVPLVAPGRSLGVLRLVSSVRRHFSKDWLHFLEAVGTTVGLALANAHVYRDTDERLRRKIRQMGELSKTSGPLTSSLEPGEVFPKIAQAAAELVGAEKAVLLLPRDSRAVVRGVAGYGFTPEEASGLVCNHVGSAAEEHLSKGTFMVCRGLSAGGGAFKDFARLHRIRTLVCIPLCEGPKAVGALAVMNTPQAVSDDDVAVLTAFAPQAVHVIRNAGLFHREQQRTREVAAAYEIARAGSAIHDTRALCRHICETVRNSLGFQSVWIGRADLTSSTVVSLAQAGQGYLELNDVAVDETSTEENIVAECATSGRPVYVENCSSDPRCLCWSDGAPSPKLGSSIAVPLVFADELLGVMLAARKEAGPFSTEQVTALNIVATEAAVAIRNSELRAEALSLYRKLSHVQELSLELTASLDLDTVLRLACKNAVEAVGLKMAWMGLISEGSYRVEPVAHYGFEEGYLKGINITYDTGPAGRGPTGRAIRTRKPVVAKDLASSPNFAPWRDQARKRGYVSSCAVPLIASGRVLGTLNVYADRHGAFTESDLELLQEFANQAAVAIHNARLHEQLRESERLKDLILQNVPYALFVIDATGHVVMANSAARTLQVQAQAAARTPHYTALLPDDHPAANAIASWINTSAAPSPIRTWYEPEGLARQFLLVYSGEVYIGGKPSLLVSVHDLTMQASIDESLERTDRLTLVGNMAAQVAHEIGNPLALMSSHIQRMMDSQHVDPGRLDILLGHVDRVAALVGNLSHMGRKAPLVKGPVHIGSLIREVVEMVRFDKRFSDIKIKIDIAPNTPRAELDRDKIIQVLLNLLLNAADATHAGGAVSVSSRVAEVVVSHNARRFAGDYVLLAVGDDGEGIAPEVMSRMWEPFYTTKPLGEGTGLGLTVSLSIVDQHRGYIEAHSAPHKGSTFTVWLPLKRLPYCWEATAQCTKDVHFSCPVFRHQTAHRCWSDREASCHDGRDWANPFLLKPDALLRET